jgi:hypothetical protein
MLVAVLKDERAARLYQEAIGRVYNHFYRHDFTYRHASANCAGISIETLRALGWRVPEQGATGRVKAAFALPYMAIKEHSLQSGRQVYDYLVAETTDLYPFDAFLAIGDDLLGRIAAGGATSTPYERMLAEDLEAVVFVRIPQFPSSRAFGRDPVASIDEYMKRVPEDRSQWKVIPVSPRPFPAELRDRDVPEEPPPASLYAVYAYGGVFFLCVVGVWRRRAGKRKKAEPRA